MPGACVPLPGYSADCSNGKSIPARSPAARAHARWWLLSGASSKAGGSGGVCAVTGMRCLSLSCRSLRPRCPPH